LECFTRQDFYEDVYTSAVAPFVLAALLTIVYVASWFHSMLKNNETVDLNSRQEHARLRKQFSTRLLLLSYLVLPPVSSKLFQVLATLRAVIQ
jgi:hypothetical protein